MSHGDVSMSERSAAVDEICEVLRIAGLRPTEARIGILRVLQASGRLLYADAIFQALGQQRAGIGLGTVYRALKLLEQQGLVLREWREDEGKDRKAMYRLKAAGDGERSVWLICAACRNQFTLADAHLHDHLIRAAAREGLELHALPVTLEFICGKCAVSMP